MSKNSRRQARRARQRDHEKKVGRAIRSGSEVQMIVLHDKLTVRQCAIDADVSTTTIYDWINKGPVAERLPSINLGKKMTRVLVRDWLAFTHRKGIQSRLHLSQGGASSSAA